MRSSVIIVTYNGKNYVDACVNSVLSANSTDLEVIVVDNGSDDGTVDFLKDKYKQIKVVALDKNYGPAYARNKGVEVSEGRYLGFLDNDTLVDPNWENEAAKALDSDPNTGIVQCKLILSKERNKLDYVGEYIGQNGFLVQRVKAGELDNGEFNESVPILAAKSAGMFIRKETFEKIEGFDKDYFIYVEETDLGWRSWLAGFKAVYIPASVVFHEFGTSTVILGKSKNNYNAKFHGTKNYILTLIKNLEGGSLARILPIHLFLWLGLAWYSLLRGDYKPFLWIHQAIFWNITNLESTLIKRKRIQGIRTVSDHDLFRIVMRKKELSYFLAKVLKVHKVGNAEGFVKTK
ncbi:hypothetical protein A3K34_03020 [candidate division WWE3 bacterium RIFOXYC1_FULL_40_10]|uniref:Glycosyltransferase 2-like domain-containing protein n=1 Tax=candidate division WWE3 bacterium RIFOXYA2_FULL_46_9 TaxID=1802636 RepID=A0A1F4W070_UNCKA|nr:MAG: hypothetical protein A3K58_03020 [candidate division WWE3 bacterium RIFOXYB1_FULL_40_22]OGC61819.1 MAG: hypothetical protein A3K37_03020 [candidate division WWE3 bacterium RIFOXYA1_FULL_40_11]OGC62837.1 MAG: hypothetical protein A2264_04180 [candidate division WWE3 bacterium RIFOXYA2_FULL_46_9]OGC64291.1 MAG: hypothetical protein A2326_00435 [candidate division WWE3 bacterium RIFOXYB2_FULL_41_6]OGC66202.1 MAG: hypothetical protein A3K34_03020 [candidate division WWE3 bacterium RIFOXYC1_